MVTEFETTKGGGPMIDHEQTKAGLPFNGGTF